MCTLARANFNWRGHLLLDCQRQTKYRIREALLQTGKYTSDQLTTIANKNYKNDAHCERAGSPSDKDRPRHGHLIINKL